MNLFVFRISLLIYIRLLCWCFLYSISLIKLSLNKYGFQIADDGSHGTWRELEWRWEQECTGRERICYYLTYQAKWYSDLLCFISLSSCDQCCLLLALEMIHWNQLAAKIHYGSREFWTTAMVYNIYPLSILQYPSLCFSFTVSTCHHNNYLPIDNGTVDSVPAGVGATQSPRRKHYQDFEFN